jgi:hypothetical protein
VQVTFTHRRPAQLIVSCGNPSRPCNETCTVSSGEQCLARSPGYQGKRFSYEDLKARGNHSRVRVDVKLVASP